MARQVFILGLDGATFDLILPWVDQGKLPGFAHLLREGCHGPLESVPNQRSAAAWSTFMTGKNPGKHGIFEFYERDPETYTIRFVNGGSRSGHTLWRILSEAGRKVVVINVPMTYPAEKLNGILIAGLDAPGVDSSGFAHPPEILARIRERFGPYVLEPGLTGFVVGKKHDVAVRKLREELAQKISITLYLTKECEWDLFVIVLRSLDAVQHCFWKYMDQNHPQYRPEEAAKYGDAIFETYRQIDEGLGRILANLGRESTLLVISDHGFGRKHPASNQLNAWLATQGLLRYSRVDVSPWVRLLGGVYAIAEGKTPRQFKEWAVRRFPWLRNRLQSHLCFTGIDWRGTRAYSDTLFPNIYINLEGREGQGIVRPGREHEQLVRRLQIALADLRDSVTGERIVERVFRREEIYWGPFLAKAPDLLIRWREDLVIHGIAFDGGPPSLMTRPRERSLVPGEDPAIISGDHELHGILVAAGADIERCKRIEGARLVDLAPTVLSLLDLPIDPDMDGRLLEEIFAQGLQKGRRPAFAETAGEGDHPEGHPYSEAEAALIRQRLQDLGYVE